MEARTACGASTLIPEALVGAGWQSLALYPTAHWSEPGAGNWDAVLTCVALVEAARHPKVPMRSLDLWLGSSRPKFNAAMGGGECVCVCGGGLD